MYNKLSNIVSSTITDEVCNIEITLTTAGLYQDGVTLTSEINNVLTQTKALRNSFISPELKITACNEIIEKMKILKNNIIYDAHTDSCNFVIISIVNWPKYSTSIDRDNNSNTPNHNVPPKNYFDPYYGDTFRRPTPFHNPDNTSFGPDLNQTMLREMHHQHNEQFNGFSTNSPFDNQQPINDQFRRYRIPEFFRGNMKEEIDNNIRNVTNPIFTKLYNPDKTRSDIYSISKNNNNIQFIIDDIISEINNIAWNNVSVKVPEVNKDIFKDIPVINSHVEVDNKLTNTIVVDYDNKFNALTYVMENIGKVIDMSLLPDMTIKKMPLAGNTLYFLEFNNKNCDLFTLLKVKDTEKYMVQHKL